MNATKLNALYDLDDEAQQVLKSLRQVMDKANRLGLSLADDADGLHLRLRVVLGAIGDHAFNNDAQAQLEADPVPKWKHNAAFNSQFFGAQPAHAGQDY